LARYVFDPDTDTCSAAAFAGASEAQLFDTFQRAVVPLLLHTRGIEVLHASAVDAPCGVVAFAARSGTGKSTLAAAFGALGIPAWADDALAWSVEAGGVVTRALPFVLRAADEAPYVRAAADPPPDPRPLAAVLLMARGRREDVPMLQPIEPPSAALLALLPHAYCFDTQDADASRRLMQHHMELAQRVPCFALTVPDARERVGDTARMLAAHFAMAPAGAMGRVHA
jgi:hypothetical protein